MRLNRTSWKNKCRDSPAAKTSRRKKILSKELGPGPLYGFTNPKVTPILVWSIAIERCGRRCTGGPPRLFGRGGTGRTFRKGTDKPVKQTLPESYHACECSVHRRIDGLSLVRPECHSLAISSPSAGQQDMDSEIGRFPFPRACSRQESISRSYFAGSVVSQRRTVWMRKGSANPVPSP